MFSRIHISILGSIQGDQLIGVSIFPSGNGCVATLSVAGDFNLPTSGEVPSSNSIDKVLAVINGRPGQADFADKVVMVSDIFRDKEKLADAIAPLL